MIKHYILDGHEPVETDMLTWAQSFQSMNRHVAKTAALPGVSVSTVFLGIAAFGSDPPLLFETTTFGLGVVEYQDRYATWEEALDGHDRIVEKVRKGSLVRLWLSR